MALKCSWRLDFKPTESCPIRSIWNAPFDLIYRPMNQHPKVRGATFDGHGAVPEFQPTSGEEVSAAFVPNRAFSYRRHPRSC